MRRLMLSVAVAVVAFGAGIVLSGGPEARAQGRGIYSTSSPCGGRQSVSEAQGGKLWVVQNCAVLLCAPQKDDSYACAKKELKFD